MRYLIEVFFSDNPTRSSYYTDGGEPLFVPENILEDTLREVRAGTGDLGDWADMRKLGDWKVDKILAHPLGEPRDVTHDPGPVPFSVDGNEVVVHSTVRAPGGTYYYACSWRYLARDPFLLTYDTVTVKHADGTVVGSVDWVGDR